MAIKYLGTLEACEGCGHTKRCHAILKVGVPVGQVAGQTTCWCESCWRRLFGKAYTQETEKTHGTAR